MKFTGAQIAAATGGVLHQGEHTGVIGTDSRTLPEGAWFVALVGPTFDGHAFADRCGAAGGVFERPVPGWTGPWVQVSDTTQALQALGRAARARLAGPVVGLTGSSGKTTTRELIVCALRQLGHVHHTAGNLNNHLGVPLTLVAAPEDAAATVLEMGTSSPGEIAVLAKLATPDVRVIVNVGPAHLEELGGLEGVAVEKGALFDTARPGDVCILNADDPFLAPRRTGTRTVRWGRDASADIRLVDIQVDATTWRTDAQFDTPVGRVSASIPAPGVHIAHNAGAALAVAHALGLDLHRAALDLGGYAAVGMRMAPVALAGGALAINDAYNANPASMRASLQTLAAMGGRRGAVLGDMLELGPDEALLHAQVVADADALGLDHLWLVGPRMVGAAGGVTRTPVGVAEDGVALAAQVAAWLEPGARILFKGSRGARVERVLEAVKAAMEAST